jgi:hypothetical protein
MVIGGTQKQADFLFVYCRRFIDRSPYLSSRIRGEPLKSETRFKNGSLIMVHAASPGGVRHAHVDCLIFDEVAVARDDMVRASFSMVAEAPYPRIVLLSTPHDPMSVFVAIWQDAEREASGSSTGTPLAVPGRTRTRWPSRRAPCPGSSSQWSIGASLQLRERQSSPGRHPGVPGEREAQAGRG